VRSSWAGRRRLPPVSIAEDGHAGRRAATRGTGQPADPTEDPDAPVDPDASEDPPEPDPSEQELSDPDEDATASPDSAAPEGPAPARAEASAIGTAALPYAVYIAAAFVLLAPLWRDPAHRMLLDNYQDQVFFEWVLTHAANALSNFDSPIFSDKINSPYGLNLMANTSVLALALPLAPLTHLAGAHVTFVLITTLALAGTACTWYLVLSRLLNHRGAAFVGGLFCGFAPSMISQATGHPNVAGQYILPLVIYTVLRLGRPGARPVRQGLVLAALVVVQAFINEELLFLTALALGVFLIVYAMSRPRELWARVPGALRALGTAVLAAGIVLAYPLYRQFFGPQSYHGLPDYILTYGADLAGFWNFSRRSIIGDPETIANMGQGPTEENTFFGWPLLVLMLALVAWLRRDPVVRALAVTAVVFGVMSLGSVVKLNGQQLDIDGPWGWLDGLPLFDSVVPTRLALVVTPLFGCLLALGVARFDAGVRERDESGQGPSARLMRLQGLAVLLMVLVPLTPTPLPIFERPYVPPFFTAGTFRAHVPPGGVVVGVPPSWNANLHSMQWQTAANQEFTIFGGYFLAPNPYDPEKRGTYGTPFPPTMQMLEQVSDTGQVYTLTPDQLIVAHADLRFVKATTIVMPAHHWRADQVRAMVDQFAGPGVLIDGMWVWDVSKLLE
jgi:hypothetical protein